MPKVNSIQKDNDISLSKLFNFIGKERCGSEWTGEESRQLHVEGHGEYEALMDLYNGTDSYKLHNRVVPAMRILRELIQNNFFDLRKKRGGAVNLSEEQKSDLAKQKKIDLEDFLIPEKQFEYLLKTGKRWVDKSPNSSYGGIVISQKQTRFVGAVSHDEMMKVESRDNLLSNFELTDFYQEKFDAEDWEIDLWIFLSQPKELAALRGNDVDSDGYVYLNKQAANSADYTRTFYFKRQVEKLLPERFLDYQGLLGLWQNKFGVNEGKIIKLISHHLSFLDARALLPEEIFFRSSLEITAPLHKEKFTWLSDREVNLEEKARFIKEAVFGSSYIQAIEEKYFSKLTPKKEVGVESKTEKKKMVIKNESESVIEGSQKKARGGKLINRMIGAIVRRYANTNEKEVNWSKIISIIKDCNPTNHDEAVVVDFGEAEKFDFGMLKVDTKDLIITWRGDKSKASSSESKYQKKQFCKYHTKILRENGKNF